jgi:CHRD domain
MARSRPTTLLVGAIVSTALLGTFPVSTVQADDDDRDHNKRNFRVRLNPFQEVPAVSSAAKGEFRLRISRDGQSMDYELSYSGLEGEVRQAHIHLGQTHVNGGISVFLCQTSINTDPTGLAPSCPQAGAVTGTLGEKNVIGPAVQGIAAGQFAELVSAIRAGKTYANVHSATFPGGELRGQIK